MKLITKQIDNTPINHVNELTSGLFRYIKEGKQFAPNIVIAGGAARYLYDGQSFSDLDVYCLGVEPEAVVADLKVYFTTLNIDFKLRKSRGVPTFYCTYETNPIQVINFVKVSSIQEIFTEFDFTCCQFAVYGGNTLMYTEEAARDQDNKELVWTDRTLENGFNLEARFWRIHKYIKKGYKLGEGQGDMFFSMPWREEDRGRVEERISNQTSGSARTSPDTILPGRQELQTSRPTIAEVTIPF